MFSLFSRWHRHKDLEEAIIVLSQEISAIRLENVKIRAKVAVDSREKQKIERETTIKSLPQDVRDILANFPDGKLEVVRDSEGHVIYNPQEEKQSG